MTMEARFSDTIGKVLEELGPDAFACWFYCGAGEKNPVPRIQDAEYAFRSGFKDFFYSVTRHPVARFIEDFEEKTALEIGYGGGRLLHAAAHVFREVIGVDIHSCQDFVREMLLSRGVNNAKLYKTDGDSLPVSDAIVDFVYSFIVFVHLSSFEVLERYIEESFRVLKHGGIASFYYGRPYSFRTKTSKNKFVKAFYSLIEPFAELILLDLLGKGYRCFPDVQANAVSLMVSRRKMRQLAKEKGFEILHQQSDKNWTQGFIVLRK